MFDFRTIFIIIILILALFCTFSCDVRARKYADIIRESASLYGLDPAVVFAVAEVESRFNERAVSPKGAIGLMQLLPSTGEWVAEKLSRINHQTKDLYDPQCNVLFGTFYLRYLFDRFEEDWQVYAAYNAGEGRVQIWLEEGIGERDIPYPETRNYVRKVKRAVRYYKGKKYAAFD